MHDHCLMRAHAHPYTPTAKNFPLTSIKVRGHLSRFLCGMMTLAKAHGYDHYVSVTNQEVAAFILGVLGDTKPPNVHIQFDDMTSRFRDRSNITTMRLDDDDIIDVAYIDKCCVQPGRQFVMFPGNALYYFSNERVSNGKRVYQDLQRYGRNFHPWSFGICVGPNDQKKIAYSGQHADWGAAGGAFKRIIVPDSWAYYVRHGGNNSPRKAPFDPKTCVEEGRHCRAGPALIPACDGFSVTEAQGAQFERLLKKAIV